MNYEADDLKRIEQVKAFYKRNGRPPTVKEMLPANDLPWHSVARRHFGSHNNLLRAAGVPVRVSNWNKSHGEKPGPPPNPPRYTKWTEEAILEALRSFHEEFGRLPLESDHANRRLPARATVRRHFATFNDAVRAAGLTPRRSKGSQPGRVWRRDQKPIRREQFESWRYDDRKGEHASIKEQKINPNPKNEEERDFALQRVFEKRSG